ncbi:MAG: transcriptional regulator NrdR [Candidatus Moranbacteria bacterium]|nr:transcriptional regulator NrdR [Candidatus Moranbacteria bacterium]
MRCPFCRHLETRVVDSRETKDGEVTRRRRECESCTARFSTYEEVEMFRLSVVKRDGRKEEYNREKIRSGLLRAFEKRPMNDEKLDRVLGAIEYELSVKKLDEIASKEIGRLVMEKLRAIDDVAYIRFASVYKSFGSIKSFEKELEKLK